MMSNLEIQTLTFHFPDSTSLFFFIPLQIFTQHFFHAHSDLLYTCLKETIEQF